MRSSWIAAVVIAVFGFVGSTLALAAPGIRDDAGFFSPSARDEASAAITDINKRFGKDVLIETFPAILDEMKSSYDPSQRDAFFSNWAMQRAKAGGVNGIYILIGKDPSYVRVSVGNETRKQAFTLEDAKNLRDVMIQAFKAKDFDRGLLDGVRFIARRMQENLSQSTAAGAARDSNYSESGGAAPSAPGPSPSPMPSPSSTPRSQPGFGFGLGTCLIPLLILVFIVWILRKALAPKYPPGGPGQMTPGQGGPYQGSGPGIGGGGGGFGRGILGGLLGGMAGGWLQDRMSRPHSGGYPPVDPGGPTGGGSGGGFSDQPADTDFSGGAGGGFDDSSGGAGGSFGDSGGDSGGSDSSGSGGDF